MKMRGCEHPWAEGIGTRVVSSPVGNCLRRKTKVPTKRVRGGQSASY
jgi:hypothetical protein